MPKMKLIALALLVAASLLVVAVQAQTTTTTEEAATTDASIEWEMFSGNIAGYGGAVGSTANEYAFPPTVQGGTRTAANFIYNQRTGKVYKYFSNCDDKGTNGCFVALPALESDFLTSNSNPIP